MGHILGLRAVSGVTVNGFSLSRRTRAYQSRRLREMIKFALSVIRRTINQAGARRVALGACSLIIIFMSQLGALSLCRRRDHPSHFIPPRTTLSRRGLSEMIAQL